MGAISFIEEVEGMTALEEFNKLVDEANEYYGMDPYNGSINTCYLGDRRLSLDKDNKTNNKYAYKYIEENNGGTKRKADYIRIGPIRYDVITCKKENTGNKPKYKMSYVVKEVYGGNEVKPFSTKKEADDYAIKMTLERKNSIYEVSKEYAITEGESTVTRINEEKKTYKNMPKLKDMPNRIIRPIYKFIFFGWASE